jgi:hypothetical protein
MSQQPGASPVESRPTETGIHREAKSPPSKLQDWVDSDVTVRAIWNSVRSRSAFTLVSGAAGTGKSTLLRLMSHELGNPPVLAPTGVAALRVNG